MDIDHVYTWVNAGDEKLNTLRGRHAAQEVRTDARYRAGAARVADHGELRASLDTAFRFLPFVRNTIIFGAGDPPAWLPDYGGRVTYVPQEQVVPPELWPSFQSNAIESFVHRIPGLSERYIYSNDDFFFARRHAPGDFFTADGRARVGLAPWPAAVTPQPTYRSVEANGVRALQRHIALPPYRTGLPRLTEQVRPRARFAHLWRFLSLARRRLPMVNAISHVSQPYLRSPWQAYHETFREELDLIYSRRFRSRSAIGVNFTYLHFLRHLGWADFYQARHDWLVNRDSGRDAWERLRLELLKPDHRLMRFCLNDNPVDHDDGWEEFVRSLPSVLRAGGEPDAP